MMINDIKTNSAVGLLTLLNLPGIGAVSARILADNYSTLGDVQGAGTSRTLKLRRVANESLRGLEFWDKAYQHAESIMESAKRESVKVLTESDASFPQNLKMADDRPLILYVKGSLSPDWKSMACIGTREPSSIGHQLATRITKTLVENGWSVISGLALGTDTICHEAALDGGGHTVAVLANGLDMVYPDQNRQLAARILENGGALVSEQPFGERAVPRHLVQRDRIQSGLSVGVTVMQTDIVGGSMHTLRYALMQNRKLFSPLPKGEFRTHPKSRGNVALTEDSGAGLCRLLFSGRDRLTKQDTDYQRLLNMKFSDSPVATILRTNEDLVRELGFLRPLNPPPEPQTRLI
jgi:DNA processing protein